METNNNTKYTLVPQWVVIGLGILIMVLVVLVIVQKVTDLQASFSSHKPANTIAVTGEGKVAAVPDLATVDIGVLSTASSASQAQSQNNQKINQIITFVKAQGVGSEDITTSNFDLSPQQDYSGSSPNITGYQVSQTVTVKIHHVDQSTKVLDTVLDGVVANGANQINGVNLSVENPTDLQNQARQKAIADAKSQAQQLAEAASLKLGKIVNVSENSSSLPPPLPYAQAMSEKMTTAPGSGADIQTGSQEIDEIMVVTFQIN